jgi:hypothetical protein
MDEHDLEYPSIDALADDYTFFPDLGSFMSGEMLTEHAVAAAAGAGGILIVQNVMDRVDYLADKPVWRAAAEFALGVAGGRLLYPSDGSRTRFAASMGLVGGVAGLGLANLVQIGMAQLQARMAASEESSAGTEGYLRGLGQGTQVVPVPPYYDRYKTSVPRSFRGLSAPQVTQANYFQTQGMAGLGAGEEPDEVDSSEDDLPSIGTWLSGAY